MSDDHSIRSAIVHALQRISRLGLARGTAGNVSVRARDGLYISPTGMAYEGMQPAQVVLLRWDGSFDGDILPSSEWRFHRDILRARPEIEAIVHTHSPHAAAVSILGHDIPAVHYMVAAAGGPTIRCAPYHTFGTPELAEAALVALQGRRACLLAHHGVIAAHQALTKALDLAVTVEEMAELYLKVLPFGPPKVLADDEMARVLDKFRSYGQQPRAAKAAGNPQTDGTAGAVK